MSTPQTKSKLVQTFGRKKNAVASASVREGKGLVRVNGAPIELVNPAPLRQKALEPLLLLGQVRTGRLDIRVTVRGGGNRLLAKASWLTIKNIQMKPKREKSKIFYYNMIEHSQLLIQEDANQESLVVKVPEPEDKRVIDENLITVHQKQYKYQWNFRAVNAKEISIMQVILHLSCHIVDIQFVIEMFIIINQMVINNQNAKSMELSFISIVIQYVILKTKVFQLCLELLIIIKEQKSLILLVVITLKILIKNREQLNYNQQLQKHPQNFQLLKKIKFNSNINRYKMLNMFLQIHFYLDLLNFIIS
ncbi:unnamed protein product [Paramecium pentaurelia]|uniref:Ribosomal protein S9 n=1 Tax=Paramecium pentaurelia TaxID=43138 RepID=A0A8S1T9P4_9CILI|nr:unnamed protein product [Paramecium pentaurelia]